ncbi:MAG TPA: protein translocase subunit SecD [Syntrophales bacterium]|nr:protein translocase subunit SecD [Syntrophales bacterium]HRT60765.1 protein translocase subunit SecD [Syntrophales bacterium]
MFQDIRLRTLIALAVCLVGLYFLIPSIVPNLPDSLKNLFMKRKIQLGLDLQGGMHLIMEVDSQKAMESTMERFANNLKESLMARKIKFRNVERTGDSLVSLDLSATETRSEFEKILSEQYPDLEVKSSEVVEGRERVVLKVKDKRVDELRRAALEQSVETIRNRVDQFGVTEPEIVPQGDNRILIQLPGIKDPKRAVNLIGKTALLEFKLLDEENSLEQAMRGNIPTGDILARGVRLDERTGQRTELYYLLKEKTLLTGQNLEYAQVKISDRFGEPYVAIKFDAQGAKDFDRITSENVGRRLAIVLDGVVHSAPVIKERISGGEAQITGTFTTEEARDLAIVLRAGALPAPVKVLEQRTVGPSLGQDSIDKGIMATLIGFLLVVVFMVVYYRLSGLVANVAVLLNIILILGTMAAFQATLTLPGIAGIILVIGMAVDANVLIFERTREELRTGKTPRAAIDAGYDKAFLTILDSNVTTLLAAMFLFQFGTGPVKGFAVTLSVGIVASMFTAIFVTRIIFDYFAWKRKIKTISI